MENINKLEEMFRKWQIKKWSAFLQDESLSRHSVMFFRLVFVGAMDCLNPKFGIGKVFA